MNIGSEESTMGLFKGLKTSKERKKAKEFYSEVPKMNTQPRELRKLKAGLGARLTAFIDKTFIEGAESGPLYSSDASDDLHRVDLGRRGPRTNT